MGFIEQYGLIAYSTHLDYPRTGPCELGIAEARANLTGAGLIPTIPGARLIFDHCHHHGWIRGVICLGCNNYAAKADAGRIASQYGYPYAERLALRRWQERCAECRAMPERRVRL